MKTKDVDFSPREGYVLCFPPEARKTEGGIVIPETAQEEGEPVKMQVVKVGPGEVTETGYRREISVRPGDVAYFVLPRYATTAFLTIKGQKYVIAQAKFICGVEGVA